MTPLRDVGILGTGLWDGPEITNDSFPDVLRASRPVDPYKGLRSDDGSVTIAGLALRPERHPRTLRALDRGFRDPFRGTVTRRHFPTDLDVSDAETDAARRALESASLGVRDIDVLLVQSFLPDQVQPRNSALVAHKLGMRMGAAWEVDSICNSTVSQAQVAAALVATEQARNVLCVQSVAYSRVRDPGSSATYQEGDLASAFVVGRRSNASMTFAWRTDGALHAAIRLAWAPPSGARARHYWEPAPEKLRIVWNPELQPEVMREVADHARTLCDEVLTRAGVAIDDVDVFVTHQPMNWFGAFMEDVLGLRDGVLHSSFEAYANVNSASVTASLHDAVRAGRIRSGSRVLIFCPGAGYTYAAGVIQW